MEQNRAPRRRRKNQIRVRERASDACRGEHPLIWRGGRVRVEKIPSCRCVKISLTLIFLQIGKNRAYSIAVCGKNRNLKKNSQLGESK